MRGQQDCSGAATQVGAGAAEACPTEIERRKRIIYSTQKEATIHPFLALRLTNGSPTSCPGSLQRYARDTGKVQYHSYARRESLGAITLRSPS